MLQLVALLAVLPAATVEPAQVPAQGRQSAILTMERAGMVRLQAKGGDGTSCAVVDQLRGPFASSGVAGREDCAVDLLLDAGRYKLRLESQAKARGKASVSLSAALFGEVNGSAVGLEAGRPVEAQLPEGKQASFWFHLEKRGPVAIRVAGRTAGAVHLWRAGEWREELTPRRFQPEPGAGQPIHEWWVQGVLEPGDYQVTAYGTAPLRFTRGEESSLLTVELGFATSPERTLRAVLPPSGTVAVATGKEPLTALLTVESPGAGRVRVSVHPYRDGGAQMEVEEGNCVVEPKAQVGECAIRAGEGGHVLVVRGPAGAAIHLRWVPQRNEAALLDGEYRPPSQRLPLEPLAPGEYLLGLHDVPGDRDAAPLGCALERQPERGGPREIQAWDAPRVSATRTFQRAFNYARYESLWFEVAEGGEYAIATAGERKTACELYRVLGDGLERITEGNPRGCGMTRRLTPGLYELKLSGGTEGIEKVRIGAAGRESGEAPARAGCQLRARLDPGYRYTLLASRIGRVAARGLVARRLPLTIESPMPLEVPAGEARTLPVGGSLGQLRITTPGGSPAGCHLAKGGAGQWRDGACWVEVKGPDELTISARAGSPLLAWIMRPAPARPPAPARLFEPAKGQLPALAPGGTVRFDFEPGQDRAVVFEVKEPALYDLGTEGLLGTTCSVRTAALPQLAGDSRGGRSRNCLVSAFLRPGRYLASVRAEAPSRGRAGVTLARRPVREVARLDGEGESFFRAEAGELIRQRLAVPKAGRWELTATALGAELRCRLEDRDGWPILPVPGPCRVAEELPEGELFWTQLPLTVESMRRSSLAPVVPPGVLRGNSEVHDLALWRQYQAELGKDGKDELRFTVPAEGDVSVLLTNGMLGRLLREGEAQPIEIIPPSDGGAGASEVAPQEEASAEADAGGEPDQPEGNGDEYSEGDAGEVGEAEGDSGEEPQETPPSAPVFRAPPPVQQLGVAPGVKVHLAAGSYRLVAEHSRGDVAISYAVQVSVDPLMPGVERELPVPSRVPLRVASPGTLRIRTAGEADVRCRLFDATGRLVAESSEVGEDWNCGLAEPVQPGDYRLEIESEMVMAGTTRLSLVQPAPTDVGALADGKRYPLTAGVLAATLPPPPGEAVIEASLEGAQPFYCAVDDDAGRLVSRSGPAKSCSAFVLPAGRSWRLRAWTLDRATDVTARYRIRPVASFDGGKLPEGGAGRARIERPGTYRTAEGVLCLAGTAGLLEPCGPEVALEAGEVVFAAPGQPKLSLDEATVQLAAGEEKGLSVGPRPRIQRLTSGKAIAHLVSVTVAPGERSIPSCRIDGGVHAPTAGGCFAASSQGKESLLRLRAIEPVEARVWRAAVTRAKEVELGAGRHRLEISPDGTELELPSGAVRAELTLPPRGWAVMFEDEKATGLCPPAPALSRCVLGARDDARVLLYAPGEKGVGVVVTSLPSPPQPRALGGLVEELAALPGEGSWSIAPGGGERVLRVEGAIGCSVALDDGARIGACEATIPPGVGGIVTVEHRAGPLRLAVAARGDGRVLAGAGAGAGSPRRLDPGEATALEGTLIERTLELSAETVVHVRAERGVCVLLSGGAVADAGGMGEGCRLDRLLPKGSHRLVVRGFAGAVLAGTLAWTGEPVETLAEGVGAERWIAPGEGRVFRFSLASRGRVGLGLREEAEVLECTVADGAGRALGAGCQQLLSLDGGTYLLTVTAPPGAPPSRFRPVLLGLAGSETGVPEEYLRDFFQRIGGTK
jgi:hypothetical protein